MGYGNETIKDHNKKCKDCDLSKHHTSIRNGEGSEDHRPETKH
jgi:hypothetical protein